MLLGGLVMLSCRLIKVYEPAAEQSGWCESGSEVCQQARTSLLMEGSKAEGL